MFYSHEILSNAQHGVATIWLVATVGRSSNRRVNRRAILEVDVPKACETILDPGAPLALRLQGSLLYGVSRVFARQCTYVLSDAEKTQSDMMMFFRSTQISDLDPNAGVTKRHHITLEDDPSFDLMNAQPNLELLQENRDLGAFGSQSSKQSLSQFTPIRLSQTGSVSSNRPGTFQLDLPRSSSSHRYQLPSDMMGGGSSRGKHSPQFDAREGFQPFGSDEQDSLPSIGIELDDDGNLVDILDQEEPQLPPLPGAPRARSGGAQEHVILHGEDGEQIVYHSGNDNVFILDEPALPDAEGFPTMRHVLEEANEQSKDPQEADLVASAAQNQKRRRIKLIGLDRDSIGLERNVIYGWHKNYVEIMEGRRKRSKGRTAAQARTLAQNLMYNTGLGGAGIPYMAFGWNHPLAEDFAGSNLRSQLLGDLSELAGERRGRRRKSSEAFEGEEEDEEEKEAGKRQRINADPEQGRGLARGQTDQISIGDDSMQEVGVDNVAPMEEKHSSIVMPWSRGGSAVPGSSVRAPGSAQRLAATLSPQSNRGSVVSAIHRYGDVPFVPSSDWSNPPGNYNDAEDTIFVGDSNMLNTQTTSELASASQDFLAYATQVAGETGTEKPGNMGNMRWIDFEQLAKPELHDKSVATQAFLHVLSLATKGVIKASQEGINEHVPFGKIEIGVTLSPLDTTAMDEDELA